MENLTELKQRVIEYLAGLSDFEDAAVVPAYPEKQRAFPLKTPMVTVETAGAELAPAGLGSYFGGDASLYGTFALLTLRFCIYHEDAQECSLLFESLCNALFEASWLGIQKIECENGRYDAKTAARVLPASAVLKTAWIASKPEERLFTGINLKDVKA